jgi:hypothetical protein
MPKTSSVLILLLLLCGLTLTGNGQHITSNIYARVFQIRYQQSVGTSFTVEVDGRQYLITAKHVVKNIKDGDEIGISRNGGWETYSVKVIEVSPPENDIAVIALPKQISPTYPIEPTSQGILVGQDAYFLGFPYELQMDGAMLNNGYPLPLVKKGICSGILTPKDEVSQILLDGINNTGFSGGPVVFVDQASKKLKIAGIVSGYRNNPDQVYIVDKSKMPPKMTPIDAIVLANAGIIYTYMIGPAITAIKANPIGVKVTATP